MPRPVDEVWVHFKGADGASGSNSKIKDLECRYCGWKQKRNLKRARDHINKTCLKAPRQPLHEGSAALNEVTEDDLVPVCLILKIYCMTRTFSLSLSYTLFSRPDSLSHSLTHSLTH